MTIVLEFFRTLMTIVLEIFHALMTTVHYKERGIRTFLRIPFLSSKQAALHFMFQ